MLNKRKKNILDPMRINNYNKFLSSLDNTNSPKKETKLEELKTTLNTDESIKNQIDKIIEKINNNFSLNNISSSNFTGQTQNDIAMSHIQPNDPNKYIDYLNKNLNIKIYKINPNIYPDIKKKRRNSI